MSRDSSWTDHSFATMPACRRGGSIASGQGIGAVRLGGRSFTIRSGNHRASPRDEHATDDLGLDEGRGWRVRSLDGGVGLVRHGVGLCGAGSCQERCPGKQDPRLGREDQRDDAVSRLTHPVDQAQPAGSQRHRGRHRRQADPDQRARRHSTPASSSSRATNRATSCRRRSRRSARDRPGRAPARGRVVLRQADAVARTEALPEVKETVLVYGYPQGARRSRSPRGSSRGSSSPATARTPRACACRSTPRSTRATAAARP